MSRWETCSCCKKIFLKPDYSIYTIKYKDAVKYFCSYTCYRKIQKLLEERNYEEVNQIINESK